MGTIYFEIRKDKKDRDGNCPIRMVYQISGQRTYSNTKEKLRPENWDQDEQQAIFIDRKARKQLPVDIHIHLLSDNAVQILNDTLAGLRYKINRIEKWFELSNTPYSSTMVLDKLKEDALPVVAKQQPRKFVEDYIDKYIEDHKATRVAGSLTVFKTMKQHLRDFQKLKNKKYQFADMGFSFFKDFHNFLVTPHTVLRKDPKTGIANSKKVVVNINNITAAKQVGTLKTFLKYAKREGIEVSDKYKDFTLKSEKLEVIALTSKEFEQLCNIDLTGNNALDKVRDVFVFSCVTGMRYSDLHQLRREHIKDNEIVFTVKKTREHLRIPLTPYSRSILAKYKKLFNPLPVISNQRMNEHLKKLCQLAKVNDIVEIVRFKGNVRQATTHKKYELVSCHTGRKTFCTLSLEKGMSAEVVMKISGHRDYRSFQRYINISQDRMQSAMSDAWGGDLSERSKKVG